MNSFIPRFILGLERGREDKEWALLAVLALVKKLKKRRGAFEDLEKVLSSPCPHSKCVRITKNCDGRIQVRHRKGYPHFIACKLWRWPDIESCVELKPSQYCQYPYTASQEEVCINPYHYNRVWHPLRDRCHSEFAPGHSLLPCQRTVPGPASSGAAPHLNGLPEIPPPAYRPFDSQQQGSNDADQAIDVTKMSADIAPAAYQKPRYWASIAYYELKCRVGDVFQCQPRTVTVDGFTNPSDSARFGLGHLTNVERDAITEKTRMAIRKGVKLYHFPEDVHLESSADCTVFVHSVYFNKRSDLHPSAVCELTPSCSMMIFSNQVFAQLLSQSVNPKDVHELMKMCTIRMSFVEGWGADYHRKDVTSTPCWIEVRLHEPLQWLHRVMTQMGAPQNAISTVS